MRWVRRHPVLADAAAIVVTGIVWLLCVAGELGLF